VINLRLADFLSFKNFESLEFGMDGKCVFRKNPGSKLKLARRKFFNVWFSTKKKAENSLQCETQLGKPTVFKIFHKSAKSELFNRDCVYWFFTFEALVRV
jgi:hypothetical protein